MIPIGAGIGSKYYPLSILHQIEVLECSAVLEYLIVLWTNLVLHCFGARVIRFP
jgi:hypothetical protein